MPWISRLFGLLLAAAMLFVGWMLYFALSPIPLKSSPVAFTVPVGTSLQSASRLMETAGVSMPAWQFTLLGRILGKSAEIKAGSYEVSAGITPLSLLEKMTRGDVNQSEVVLLEGWTFRQMRAALDAHPDIRHDTAGWSERQILTRLGIDGAAEGRFFPDTYLFAKGTSDLDIYRRAYWQMNRILQKEWDKRDADLPYVSSYEALIMASIVEKETGQSQDRQKIASVFLNRLKKGMLLQTDPSVIYGLGESFDGNLRKRDLQTDGPYNTYTRTGLPPTPIAMPGLESIRAALHPAITDHFYFVARGDGTSHFSRTLEEHNRAVAKYQLRKGN